MALTVSLFISALAGLALEPAFAGLHFCNRAKEGGPLALAVAWYSPGTSHTREDGLSIKVKPRWTVRGWWEMGQNDCVTVIGEELSQPYYYYTHNLNSAHNYSGSYQICGNRYGRFHMEYEMENNELVKILALNASGIDSASVNSDTDLAEACAELNYELLPFQQLHVGNASDYTFVFQD